MHECPKIGLVKCSCACLSTLLGRQEYDSVVAFLLLELRTLSEHTFQFLPWLCSDTMSGGKKYPSRHVLSLLPTHALSQHIFQAFYGSECFPNKFPIDARSPILKPLKSLSEKGLWQRFHSAKDPTNPNKRRNSFFKPARP